MANKDTDDVSPNAALLVWPQDQTGFLNKLKPELTKAAGRINGKEEKLQAFLSTLRIAAAHAKARYKNQKAENDRQVEQELERQAAAEAITALVTEHTVEKE